MKEELKLNKKLPIKNYLSPSHFSAIKLSRLSICFWVSTKHKWGGWLLFYSNLWIGFACLFPQIL